MDLVIFKRNIGARRSFKCVWVYLMNQSQCGDGCPPNLSVLGKTVAGHEGEQRTYDYFTHH